MSGSEQGDAPHTGSGDGGVVHMTDQTEQSTGPHNVVHMTDQTEQSTGPHNVVHMTDQAEQSTGPHNVVHMTDQAEQSTGPHNVVHMTDQAEQFTGPHNVVHMTDQAEQSTGPHNVVHMTDQAEQSTGPHNVVHMTDQAEQSTGPHNVVHMTDQAEQSTGPHNVVHMTDQAEQFTGPHNVVHMTVQAEQSTGPHNVVHMTDQAEQFTGTPGPHDMEMDGVPETMPLKTAVAEDGVAEDGVPYDEGWAWMIVLGCFTQFALACGYGKSIGLFFSELLQYFGSSSTHTSLLFGIRGAVYSIGGLCVMNVVVGRLGCRKTVVIGAMLFSLSSILASLANDLTLLIFVQAVLFGLAEVMVISPGEVLIALYFRRRRALAIAVAKCGASIGGMALPPLISHLLAQYGLRGAFLLTGAVCLHSLPAGLLFRPLSYFRTSRTQTKKVLTDTNSSQGRTTPTDSEVEMKRFDRDQNARTVIGNKRNLSCQDDVFELDMMQENPDGMSYCSDIDFRTTEPQGLTLEQSCHNTGTRNHLHEQSEDMCSIDSREHLSVSSSTQHSESKDGDIKQVERHWTNSSTSVSEQHRKEILPTTLQEENSDVQKTGGTSEAGSRDTQTNRSCMKCLLSGLCILDCSLFRRPTFILLFCCFALYPNVDVAVAYLPVVAQENGVTDSQAAMLLSIVGALDLVSRLGSGIVVSRKLVRASRAVQIAFVFLALMYHSVRFMTSFGGLLALAVLQGVLGGVGNSMVPLLIVHCVGVDDLAKGLGFYQLAAGSYTMAIHPLLGYIRDSTGSYVLVYHMTGLGVFLAALLIGLEGPVGRLEARRQGPRHGNKV